MKALRYVLYALLALILLALIGAVIFVSTFDANRYKPEIEKLVLERTGRTLKLSGDVKLTLYPNIGAEIGKASLSGKDPKETFITIDSTDVSVALMPLLSGKVLVNGVNIHGLIAFVTRDQGGQLNFADLFGSAPDQASSARTANAGTPPQTLQQTEVINNKKTKPLTFDISSMALTHATINYTDIQSGLDIALNQLNLTTGQLAPQSSGQLVLSAEAVSRSLALSAKFLSKADYKLNLTQEAVTQQKNGFSHPILQLDPLSINLSVINSALGIQPLVLNGAGQLLVDAQPEKLNLKLSGKLDDSPLNADISVLGFDSPAVVFDVLLNQLNLDRFTHQSSSMSDIQTADRSQSSAPIPSAKQASNVQVGKSNRDSFDLSYLKGHNIKGTLQVKQMTSQGVAIDNFQATLLLSQGRLSVAPHSAQLLGGKLSGSFSVDSHTNQFALKENLTGINIESLLIALGQAPKLTGQGALALDLITSGQTAAMLKQNLAGTANINLRDGTVKGIDIHAILNTVRLALNKAPLEQGAAGGQTTFTDMTASATIAQGIVTNRDLNVKAPLFRLTGNGTINIPASSLDYLAQVAVVETSSGQGGADLATLRGITVPVRITGPLDSPRYQVDVASLATELTKSKLGDKAQEEINKIAPGLGDALKGLFGR